MHYFLHHCSPFQRQQRRCALPACSTRFVLLLLCVLLPMIAQCCLTGVEARHDDDSGLPTSSSPMMRLGKAEPLLFSHPRPRAASSQWRRKSEESAVQRVGDDPLSWLDADSALPYPVVHASTVLVNRSLFIIGGCARVDCRVDDNGDDSSTAHNSSSSMSGGYHLNSDSSSWSSQEDTSLDDDDDAVSTTAYYTTSIEFDVESREANRSTTLVPLPRGVAGRFSSVVINGLVYVVRACSFAPTEVARLAREAARLEKETYHSAPWPNEDAASAADRTKQIERLRVLQRRLRSVQDVYAEVAVFHPEVPSVDASVFTIPVDRVRVNASCVALGNRIYVVGGYLLSHARLTSSVDVLDVTSGHFTSQVASLPVPVALPVVAASPTAIAVAGGVEEGWYGTQRKQQGERREHHDMVKPLRYSSFSKEEKEKTEDTNNVSHMQQRDVREEEQTEPRMATSPFQFPTMARLTLLLQESSSVSLRRGVDGVAATGSNAFCVTTLEGDDMPHAVQAILLDENGCHVLLFAGQLVIGDANFSTVALLDLRVQHRRDAAETHTDVDEEMKGAESGVTHRALRDAPWRLLATSATNANREPSSLSPSSVVDEALSSRMQPVPPSYSVSSASSSSEPVPPPAPTPTPVRTSYLLHPLITAFPQLVPYPSVTHATSTAATDTLQTPQPRGVHQDGSARYMPSIASATTTFERSTSNVNSDEESDDSASNSSSNSNSGSDDDDDDADKVNASTFMVYRFSGLQVTEWHFADGHTERVTESSVAIASASLLHAFSTLQLPTPQLPKSAVIDTTSTSGVVALRLPVSDDFRAFCSSRSGRTAGGHSVHVPKKSFPVHSPPHSSPSSSIAAPLYNVNGEEEEELCAVRLSSRRDCLGNAAGTLDVPYSGAPNLTVSFSASGSSSPVYVCVGYLVYVHFSFCGAQQWFSVIDPLRPLSIVAGTPAPPPPPPPVPTTTTPVPDPRQRTTSALLYILMVASLLTVMVAVLLVAKLQRVPEEGLLDWFTRPTSEVPVISPFGFASTSARFARTYGAGVQERMTCEERAACEAARRARVSAAASMLRHHEDQYRVLSMIGEGPHSLVYVVTQRPKPQRRTGASGETEFILPGGGGGGRSVGRSRVTGVGRNPSLPSAVEGRGGLSGFGQRSAFPHASSDHMNVSTAALPSSSSSSHATPQALKFVECPSDHIRSELTRQCERLRDVKEYHPYVLRPSDLFVNYEVSLLWKQQEEEEEEDWGMRRPSAGAARVRDSGGGGGRDADEEDEAAFAETPTSDTEGDSEDDDGPCDSWGDSTQSDRSDSDDSSDTTSTRSRSNQRDDASREQHSERAGANDPAPCHGKERENGEEGAVPAVDRYEPKSASKKRRHEQRRGRRRSIEDAARETAERRALPQREEAEAASQVVQRQERRGRTAEANEDDDEEGSSVEDTDATQHEREPLLLRQRHPHVSHHHHPSGTRVSSAEGVATTTTTTATTSTSNHERVPPPRPARRTGATEASSLHVCWAAREAVATGTRWNLCLVMPYCPRGDLARFIAQQVEVLLATRTADRTAARSASIPSLRAPIVETVPRVAAAGTGVVSGVLREEVVCSVAYQLSSALIHLHGQSPPILHGNVKPTNVLLRTVAPLAPSATANAASALAPSPASSPTTWLASTDRMTAASFRFIRTDSLSAASKLVGTTPSPATTDVNERDTPATVAQATAASPFPPSSLAPLPPLTTTSLSSSPTLTALAASMNHGIAGALHTTTVTTTAAIRSGSGCYTVNEGLFLPIALSDVGMSWWTTQELPWRFAALSPRGSSRPCEALQRSVDGRRWLGRRRDVAALAWFLQFTMQVPPHVAPEQWLASLLPMEDVLPSSFATVLLRSGALCAHVQLPLQRRFLRYRHWQLQQQQQLQHPPHHSHHSHAHQQNQLYPHNGHGRHQRMRNESLATSTVSSRAVSRPESVKAEPIGATKGGVVTPVACTPTLTSRDAHAAAAPFGSSQATQNRAADRRGTVSSGPLGDTSRAASSLSPSVAPTPSANTASPTAGRSRLYPPHMRRPASRPPPFSINTDSFAGLAPQSFSLPTPTMSFLDTNDEALVMHVLRNDPAGDVWGMGLVLYTTMCGDAMAPASSVSSVCRHRRTRGHAVNGPIRGNAEQREEAEEEDGSAEERKRAASARENRSPDVHVSSYHLSTAAFIALLHDLRAWRRACHQHMAHQPSQQQQQQPQTQAQLSKQQANSVTLNEEDTPSSEVQVSHAKSTDSLLPPPPLSLPQPQMTTSAAVTASDHPRHRPRRDGTASSDGDAHPLPESPQMATDQGSPTCSTTSGMEERGVGGGDTHQQAQEANAVRHSVERSRPSGGRAQQSHAPAALATPSSLSRPRTTPTASLTYSSSSCPTVCTSWPACDAFERAVRGHLQQRGYGEELSMLTSQLLSPVPSRRPAVGDVLGRFVVQDVRAPQSSPASLSSGVAFSERYAIVTLRPGGQGGQQP